jgi:hypothetical protein
MKPTHLSLRLLSAAAVALLTATGCFFPAQARQRRANELRRIGIAYHALNDAAMRGPSRAEDLAPYFENDPELLGLLKSGDVVFQYGVSVRDIVAGDHSTSDTVLAYEKDVPTRGGLALMADGSTKDMTPDEFRRATLAKPLVDKGRQ